MFKHVLLPKMASRFEERLLAALQPLMQHEYIGKLKDMLRPKFNAIFCAALELKTFVMVSKDMYHCIWPAPNSLFDPKTMETERDKFHPNDSEGYTDQMKVRLVLVPGLCVYGYDRQLVDYFGFRREGEVSTAEPQVLYKAVVLV
jgi:hypothetical protein